MEGIDRGELATGCPRGVLHTAYANRFIRGDDGTNGMSRERGDGGRYTETVTSSDVLAVFEAVEGPVVTSGDVAEHVGCSSETARRKLTALEDQGRLASRKTVGRVVWWVVDGRDVVAEIDPDDPFWDLETGSSGRGDVSENVDDHLYGDA